MPSLQRILLDLFCGMGGWSIGFYREGFTCVGVDIVDVGYPYELLVEDIHRFHGKRLFNAVVASPPCTEFSPLTALSYRKGQRGPPDPEQGLDLVKEAKRVIDECNPSYWVIENVHGSIKYIEPILGAPKIVARPWVLWGEFPFFDLPAVQNKGGDKVGLPEDFYRDPLRSWKRARIPTFLAQRMAQACKAGKPVTAQTRLL